MSPNIVNEGATAGREIRMDQNVIDEVTRKWSALGLPGTGKPIWK